MSDSPKQLDLADARARLNGTKGREYWRSLEDLASTPEFRDLLEREFPRHAVGWSDDENPVEGRRNFLKLAGASLALGGLAACTRQPTENIVPYTRQPEELIPGKPLFYASAFTLHGVAKGVLVESHEGRPTKIEGNPEHPASLGAADSFMQASVLELYDPDRLRTAFHNGDMLTWSNFFQMLREILAYQQPGGGAGIRILTETVTSPVVAGQLAQIKKMYPASKWHQWEPAGPHTARAGAQMAFGAPVNTYYNFENAAVVVAIDSDFLTTGPASLRYARQFSARRRVQGGATTMSRLYAVEPMPTPTGSKADHRLPLRASEIEAFTRALAALTGPPGAAWTFYTPSNTTTAPADGGFKSIKAIAADLAANKGASVVIAGEHQPPIVHALAHAMNASLGNVGKTVFYTDPIEADPSDQLASLQDLVKDLDAGSVDLLLILGGNPAFNAPVELGLGDRLKKANHTAHLSSWDDETSEFCQWHLPQSHYLETWGDARAFDGTVTIQQPLIEPLYDSRSVSQVLQMMIDAPEMTPYEVVKGYWAAQHKGADFEAWWRRAVHDGVIADTALPVKTPAVKGGLTPSTAKPQASGAFEVLFRPDPAIHDGRYANNGWLQELPKPITKMTWDNAAIMSPADAQKLGVSPVDPINLGMDGVRMVELTYQGRSLKAPVFVQPGHAEGAVTIYLGYGRTKAGHTGNGQGFNPYGLRTASALWNDDGLEVKKIDGLYLLATTQNFHVFEGERHVVHEGTLAEYLKEPESVHDGAESPPASLTIYPQWSYDKYAWGMAIDLNACTGCSACVVACQAENNIAVVGKDQVRRGRAMHWIRVDSYYKGPEGDPNPEVFNQPVPCQQCENAPCELVCPVQATTHSSEGLNDMVYNRCVGTRYCSNNCPYKVRRFNFYLFSDFETPSLKLQRNPDVTVRSRGVMEKCTYCVQRINYAKIEAEKQNRQVREGDIQTACQATCPAEAIVFGNLNDPESRVSKMKKEKLNYGLMDELNTRPRTTYLASLRNPNPEIGS